MKQLAMFGGPDAPGGDFDEWWNLYPHRVGKGAARIAYRRAAAKADRVALLDGVRRYVAAKPADRPYCNPATWLNQERWLDQPAPSAPARNGDDSDHILRGKADLMARGINVASVTTRQVIIMVARGWLTKEQARAHGWDLDDAY